MEYAMTLDGERIGFATTPEQAVSTLNEVYADRAALLAAELADEGAQCPVCGEWAISDATDGAVRDIQCHACGFGLEIEVDTSADLPALLTAAQAEAAPLLEARAIRETDLTALRAAVNSQLLTGCLAALVHSAHGMHLRGVLLDACELCGDPASVTLRIGSERLRLCEPCFAAGWRDNTANPEQWNAVAA